MQCLVHIQLILAIVITITIIVNYHCLLLRSNVLCLLDHSQGEMASRPLNDLAFLLPSPDTLLLPHKHQL